jgi:uncharacterized protein YbaP (TraB family)
MKILNSFILVFVVLAFTNAALAQKAKVSPKPKTAKQKITPVNANGLLYKISGKGLAKPSYLFGTIHIICPNDVFGMDKLSAYFDQTERLYLELDMDNPEVMGKLVNSMNMPEGKTLKDYLTEEKYAKVDEMFRNILGVPVGMLGKFNPFGLSVAISTSPKSIGCAAPDSYELKLLSLAAAAQKPVEGLETVEEQIAAINKTPIEKQAEDLYKMSLDPQKSMNQFKDLLATYKMQDSEKLVEMILTQSSNDEQFRMTLLDERNKNWIPKIEKIIAEKPTFIAVGGGHLGGRTGVVNLLREQGYKVTAIRF